MSDDLVREPQCQCGRPVCASLSLAEVPAHLQYATSSRGFDFMPAIMGAYEGCQIRVYESSSAEAPSLWLRAEAPANLNQPGGEKVNAPIHLRLDAARQLAEQIIFLVDNHYSNGL